MYFDGDDVAIILKTLYCRKILLYSTDVIFFVTLLFSGLFKTLVIEIELCFIFVYCICYYK